ncbi:MAG: hypothetical protein K6U80_19045 [Firmicutes bacterium]|nr:hypothetical protein [Bacillota bacterium]
MSFQLGAAERLNSKGGVGKTGLEARKRFGVIFGEAFSGLMVLGGNQNGWRGWVVGVKSRPRERSGAMIAKDGWRRGANGRN